MSLITRPWDGQTEEGVISRVDHKWPWVYVVQPAEEVVDGRIRQTDQFMWGVYSQSSTRAFATGVTESVDLARSAAVQAGRDLNAALLDKRQRIQDGV